MHASASFSEPTEISLVISTNIAVFSPAASNKCGTPNSFVAMEKAWSSLSWEEYFEMVSYLDNVGLRKL